MTQAGMRRYRFGGIAAGATVADAGTARSTRRLDGRAHRLYERYGFRRAPEFDMMVEERLQLLSYVLEM